MADDDLLFAFYLRTELEVFELPCEGRGQNPKSPSVCHRFQHKLFRLELHTPYLVFCFRKILAVRSIRLVRKVYCGSMTKASPSEKCFFI